MRFVLGTHPRRTRAPLPTRPTPPHPAPLTAAAAGRVVRAGERARVSTGDEVFGRQTLPRMREVNGAYAEYVVVDSADLAVKPRTLSHDEAAAVPQAPRPPAPPAVRVRADWI